jgi:hypothetical protein
MRRIIKRFAPIVVACAGVGQAVANNWAICIDPNNNNPRSNDWGINSVSNELMRVTVGGSGTITYGGQNGPCFVPAATANMRGRIGFSVGSTGSSQTTFDNFMALTFGMPIDPAGNWSYAMLVNTEAGTPLNAPNPARSLFGANGWVIFFSGASDRYIYGETVNDGIRIGLRADVVGDNVRLDWLLTNTTADTRNLGLWFGQWVALLPSNFEDRGFAGFPSTYNIAPGRKPLIVEERFRRARDGENFPAYINFNHGQTLAYGLKINNSANAEVSDPLDPTGGQSPVDEVVFGSQFFLLGSPTAAEGTMPDITFAPGNDGKSDVTVDDTAYIQKWYPRPVNGNGGQRRIVSFYGQTWSVGSYTRPYTVVVDTPRLLPASTGAGSQNGLGNNPMRIRVYVDNIRGFATVDQEIPLSDVKVNLTLPQGLSLAPGQTARKIISTIPPRAIRFVDYTVIADGKSFGNLNYRVSVDPTPGPTKEINGTIVVAATPRLDIQPDANLFGAPFTFTSNAWSTILGLAQPTDFQAFDWDATQQSYVLSTGAKRGVGTWIVSNRNTPIERNLGGNPQTPADLTVGAPPIQLKPGWNLVANPYNYAFPLGQIVGVSAANPSQSFTWSQLIGQGVISSALAFWNTSVSVPRYEYIEGLQALMQPKIGYWIFVPSGADVTLNFPAIFTEFLPNSSRSRNTWTQSDKQWRLQVVARTQKAIDDMNYVGVVRTEQDAIKYRIYEPPIAPRQSLSVGIDSVVNGRPVRLAQALNANQGRQQYKVMVETKEAGPVTLTWPNLATLPRNVRLRLVDTASGATRDMRRASGYTFTAEKDALREFRIEATPGLTARAVIGNVVVSSQTRDRSGPIAITYTLSSEANTTIRILGGNGREVFTVTRGRADRAGENSVLWALRDNQNRSVAPGSYQVEITAETTDGERVRRFVPVNVIR